MLRTWDRKVADFVEVPVQRELDCTLACKDCRYFDEESQVCQGVGSAFYQKQVPHQEFVPRIYECEVRLPLGLLSFV